MNNISIKQIRTFLAVVETGSFRAASERVHLSQPAVTAHVQQLEDELGIAVLDRTTRRVRVTRAGERFRHRAERLLTDLGDIVDELKDEAALQRGRVVIACVPTIAARFLPDAMARFQNQFPGIQLSVHDVVAADILGELVRDEAEIGIGPSPPKESDFEFERLARDAYVAIVPKQHPWTRRRSVTLKDLTEAPFLTMTKDSIVREILDSALAAERLRLVPLHETKHHYTLGGMVEAGLGVTALPSMAVSMLSQPLLKTIPIRRPAVYRDVGIIKYKGKKLTPAVQAFVEVFRDQVRRWRTSG